MLLAQAKETRDIAASAGADLFFIASAAYVYTVDAVADPRRRRYDNEAVSTTEDKHCAVSSARSAGAKAVDNGAADVFRFGLKFALRREVYRF